jgi:hypothetical protein
LKKKVLKEAFRVISGLFILLTLWLARLLWDYWSLLRLLQPGSDVRVVINGRRRHVMLISAGESSMQQRDLGVQPSGLDIYDNV